MKLTPLASGSSGNCYRVDYSDGFFLIECGIPWKKIMKALDYKLPKFILVSHEHKDHCLAVKDALKRGVEVYSSLGTSEIIGGNILYFNEVNFIHNLEIIIFETVHDAVKPCGFLIRENTGDTILFATDTRYIKPRFKYCNILAIECNYLKKLAQNDIDTNTYNHMEFETVKEFIRVNELQGLREIYLIHLSSRYSDPELFVKDIQTMTGVPVYVA